MKEVTEDDRKTYDRLARSMCAAFISATTAIPHAHAWDAVAQGPIGDSWILIAKISTELAG